MPSITDIYTTAFIWIVFVVLIFLVIFIAIGGYIRGGGEIKYHVGFIEVSNKPYIYGSLLGHYDSGGRQFFEHAIEIMTTGSKEKTYSDSLETDAKEFFMIYQPIGYKILIESEGKKVFEIDESKDLSNLRTAEVPLLFKDKKGSMYIMVSE